MALWPDWLKLFRSFQNKFGLWPANPRKKTGWNTVKRNVFDFSGNSTGSGLHGCCFLGNICFILQSIRTMFFNELVQFSVDGSSSWANSNVKTAQLANGFCFLIDKPTSQNRLILFWNTYLLFHREILIQLSFLLLVMKLFQQIFWTTKTSTFSCIA